MEQPTPLAYSPTDAARALSVGRSTLYRLIADGRLPTVKIGTRTLIPAEAVRRVANEGTEGPRDAA